MPLSSERKLMKYYGLLQNTKSFRLEFVIFYFNREQRGNPRNIFWKTGNKSKNHFATQYIICYC